jgi:hypothetical protein
MVTLKGYGVGDIDRRQKIWIELATGFFFFELCKFGLECRKDGGR